MKLYFSPPAGIPAPVDNALVWAWSQTELQILWSAPLNPNTDNALLRYTLLYGVQLPNTTYPLDGSFLKPSSNIFLMNYTIPGLNIHTTYNVAVLCCSEIGCNPSIWIASGVTFGLAPRSVVQGILLTYNALGKEIIVAWAPLITHSPEGEVAFYEGQYGHLDSTPFTFKVHAPMNTVSLVDVQGDIQIRVRAAVKVRESPELYEYNQWSGWTSVLTNTPPTPTVQTSSTEEQKITDPPVKVIIPSVTVPVVVVLSAVCGLALFLYYCKRKSSHRDTVGTTGDAINVDLAKDDDNDTDALTSKL